MIPTCQEFWETWIFGIRAKTWAIFISWAQISIHIVLLIPTAMTLGAVLFNGPDDFEYFVDEGTLPLRADYLACLFYNDDECQYDGAVPTLIGTMSFFLTGTLFGWLLLQGTMKNKVGYLNAWTFFAIFSSVSLLIITVTFDMLPPTEWGFIIMGLLLTLHGFAIFVVVSLIEETRKNLRSSKRSQDRHRAGRSRTISMQQQQQERGRLSRNPNRNQQQQKPQRKEYTLIPDSHMTS